MPCLTHCVRQNYCHSSDDIFNSVFLYANCCILIQIALKFVDKCPLIIMQHWCRWIQIAKFMGQHGAHLDTVSPRWAPYWPHESCSPGSKYRRPNSRQAIMRIDSGLDYWNSYELLLGISDEFWFYHLLRFQPLFQLVVYDIKENLQQDWYFV